MATSVVFPRVRFFTDGGHPLAGGRIHTYVAGTGTRARTYRDAANAQPNTNPILLDSRGEAAIYLAEGVEYKFVVEDHHGSPIMTQEPVYGAVWPNIEQWPSDASLAYRYMMEARAAAEATGPIKFYDTYAGASIDRPNLQDGDVVEIFSDETRQGARTRYRLTAGVLVFKVNLDQLRIDLGDHEIGANAVAFNGENTVHDALRSLINDDGTYRRSVVAQIPLNWAGRSQATAQLGLSGGYWYPQGMAYDDIGYVYLNYSYSTGGRCVVVVYDEKFEYIGWFSTEAGGESIVARGSVSLGSLKIYRRTTSSNLAEYAIGSMPTNGSALSPSRTVITGEVGLQFAYGDGIWVLEQYTVDFGLVRSRTAWVVYNDNFERVGQFFVKKNIVGYQTANVSPYYPSIPKTQGIAVANGCVYFGVGGSYIPDAVGPVSPTVADFGIAEIRMDGSLGRYGVCRADETIRKLAADGYSVIRSESEGLTRHPSGDIHHIFVGLRPGSDNAGVAGILIFKEFDRLAESWHGIRSHYVPFDVSRYSAGIWPRSNSNKMLNPLTHEAFNTLIELLDFMCEFQLPSASYYSGAVDIALPEIISNNPGSHLVEIKNINNTAAKISLSTYGANTNNAIFQALKSGGTWNFYNSKFSAQTYRMRPFRQSPGGDKVCYISSQINSSDSDEFLALGVAATSEENFINIGGSSSIFKAATYIRFATASDNTEQVGVVRWVINKEGVFRPWGDNEYSIGYGSNRISQLFAGNGTINTSDAREKTSPLLIDDTVLDAWGDVQLVAYQWLSAIQQKGIDSARWHFGVIAQQVRDAFAARGIDGTRYGLLCYDEWSDIFEPIFATRNNQETGEAEEYDTGERRIAIAAGNRWGIRADQCLFVEAAYQRREMQRLKDRISAVERGV